MVKTTNILLVEDDEDDFILAQELLLEVFGEQLELKWITNERDAKIYLSSEHAVNIDVCFIDFMLGAKDGLTLVRFISQQSHCKAPAILLTGMANREIDVMAMEAGATDYLVKDKLDAETLERTIRYAINKKESEQHTQQLAFRDVLTGLPNRRLLQDRLTQSLARIKRSGAVGALFFLDLDHFKTINDSLGHSVGDALLQEVAQRISACTREEDTVARLGGDEFVVLLPALASKSFDAVSIAENIAKKILTQLATPIVLNEQDLHVSCSIGITMLSGNDDGIDAVLRQADTAMYDAKHSGRNTFRFFEAGMEAAVVNKLNLEMHIRRAIRENKFELHYQPLVDGTSLEIIGCEALIRWQDEDLGSVSPADFIPVAEDSGLIIPLGEWVLEEACSFLADNLAVNLVAVNISAEQFSRPNFLEMAQGKVEKAGINPQRLIFEITETSMLTDVDTAKGKMDALREFGIRFALDDFGTGYSSLSYLRKLPFDVVKIDHTFTQGIIENSGDKAVVRAILDLSDALGFSVTVEGVETIEQMLFLQEHNCNNFQGYLFSKALPGPDFLAALKNTPPGWPTIAPPNSKNTHITSSLTDGV